MFDILNEKLSYQSKKKKKKLKAKASKRLDALISKVISKDNQVVKNESQVFENIFVEGKFC